MMAKVKKKTMADTVKPVRRKKKKTDSAQDPFADFEEVKEQIHGNDDSTRESQKESNRDESPRVAVQAEKPDEIVKKRMNIEMDEDLLFEYKAWCAKNRVKMREPVIEFIKDLLNK